MRWARKAPPTPFPPADPQLHLAGALSARINFDCADELVDSSHTRPKEAEFIRAELVDPRGGYGLGRASTTPKGRCVYARHLSLIDYRSWAAVEVPLRPGVNVLIGRNGTGKTNLVEALGYLATLSSHRVASDAPLIRRGSERAVEKLVGYAWAERVVIRVQVEPHRPEWPASVSLLRG